MSLAAREKLSDGTGGKGHCVGCVRSAGLVQLCGHQKDLAGGQAYKAGDHCASLIDLRWHRAYGETLTLTGRGPVDKQAGLCQRQEIGAAGAWVMLWVELPVPVQMPAEAFPASSDIDRHPGNNQKPSRNEC